LDEKKRDEPINTAVLGDGLLLSEANEGDLCVNIFTCLAKEHSVVERSIPEP